MLVVEPRAAVSRLRPRAKTTSIRTMEHFRRWGLARRIREVAPLPVEWSQDVVFCTSLAGDEIARFTGAFGLTTERSDLFAETSQQIPQPLVEEVLREAVGGLAAGWRAERVDELDAECLVAVAGPDGERREVRARYLVGADGAGGVARRAIGAQYAGSSDPRPNLTLVFRAPGLERVVRHGPAIQYWTLDPRAPSYLGRLDLGDTWWIGLIGVESASDEEAAAFVRAAAGAPVDVEVLSADPWLQRMLHVDHYASRRVFLAGDAAHVNPPWGGHGFNTGIGDAVNVGWKLAARVAGWAGAGLLASYERERRPVAEATIALAQSQTTLLAVDLARATGEEILAAKQPEFHGLGLVLGYAYGDRPVPADTTRYEPTAAPGARLPHLWLPDGRSVYDALGREFTLIRTAGAEVEPLVRAAAEAGVPLELVDLPQAAELYEAPLVLVRPDQHVAWRGEPPRDPGAVVDAARGAEPLGARGLM